MLPQPLRGILVGVILLSVVVMFASGASRYGDREPESWGLFWIGLGLFLGALAVGFVAKIVLALREGRAPSFRIESPEARAYLRRKIRTFPFVLLAGLAVGGIAIAIGECA